MAIVVLAYEYRPAVDTVHRGHADLCFSRTGVARVGTLPPRYGAAERGFLAVPGGDTEGLCALSARYAPWIAVELKGEQGLFGPMNFDLRHRVPELSGEVHPDDSGDSALSFWVPLHKLFSGSECLRGLELEVDLEAGHVNEKLRRVHLELRRSHLQHGQQHPGHHDKDLSSEPFTFREGIAELSTVPDHGKGVLAPVAHPRLVEPAEHMGAPLDFVVPSDQAGADLGPSLALRRPVP